MNIANPVATVLSAGMMLKYSFGLKREAEAVEKAVLKALNDGYRTRDIMTQGMKQAGTIEMGKLIAERIEH
jgi:3-isopropylmalate dehydrogenase